MDVMWCGSCYLAPDVCVRRRRCQRLMCEDETAAPLKCSTTIQPTRRTPQRASASVHTITGHLHYPSSLTVNAAVALEAEVELCGCVGQLLRFWGPKL
eukprot:scaffold367_cov202-Alexandrium_tamarense.AAC.39